MRRFQRFLPLVLLPALLAAQPKPAGRNNVLFQVSTIDALTLGLFQGALDFGDLKHQGDFGVGTFEGLDGERSRSTAGSFRRGRTGPYGVWTARRPHLSPP